MEKIDNKNLVNDIMNQKKLREAEPPTLDEIAEQTAKTILSTKQLPRSVKDLNDIISKLSSAHPEKDKEFMLNIPQMHKSWQAIIHISKHHSLSELYALVMVKVYKEQLPFDIEKIICALDTPHLIEELYKKGIKWSERSQRLIEKFYPQTYKKLFEHHYSSDGFMS